MLNFSKLVLLILSLSYHIYLSVLDSRFKGRLCLRLQKIFAVIRAKNQDLHFKSQQLQLQKSLELESLYSISMAKSTTSATVLKDFQLISKLGDGSFAQVFKVLRKEDCQIYAMKKVKMARISQKDRNNALNEIRILASEKCENVIQFKEAFYDDPTSNLCIVMQYAKKGDLSRLIQSHVKAKTKIPENQIWKALVHIAKGLKSLHDKKILHRDLKGANVFITQNGIYKLGDLNVSKVIKSDFAKTQTGTPYYASPEVWKNQPYGIKSDMWSLGCILYEMAAQRPPFTAVDIPTLFEKIMSGNYPRIPLQYSKQLAGIISTLLKLDPNERPTAHDLLSNPLVQSHSDQQYKENVNGGNDELLSTIIWQNRNMKMINQVLPKANYQKKQSGQQMKASNVYTEETVKKKEKNFFNSKTSRVQSSHQNGQKQLQKENTTSIKRQRIASSNEVVKKDEGSSIDQISIFKEIAYSQKVTKKEPIVPINRSIPSTKSTSQYAMPPKSIHDSKKKIQSLVSKILNQEDVQGQNLRNIGQQIVNSTDRSNRKDIAQYR